MKFLKMTFSLKMSVAERVPDAMPSGPVDFTSQARSEAIESMRKDMEKDGVEVREIDIETVEIVEI